MKINQRESAIEAYHEGHRSMEDRVYRFLVSRGKRGATILEVASALSVDLGRVVASNEITGRLTDLKNERHGARGYRVLVAPWRRACEVNCRNKMIWLAVPGASQLEMFGGAA